VEARTPSSQEQFHPWKKVHRWPATITRFEESSIAPMRALARCWRETRWRASPFLRLGMGGADRPIAKMLKALGSA